MEFAVLIGLSLLAITALVVAICAFLRDPTEVSHWEHDVIMEGSLSAPLLRADAIEANQETVGVLMATTANLTTVNSTTTNTTTVNSTTVNSTDVNTTTVTTTNVIANDVKTVTASTTDLNVANQLNTSRQLSAFTQIANIGLSASVKIPFQIQHGHAITIAGTTDVTLPTTGTYVIGVTLNFAPLSQPAQIWVECPSAGGRAWGLTSLPVGATSASTSAVLTTVIPNSTMWVSLSSPSAMVNLSPGPFSPFGASIDVKYVGSL